MEDLNRYLSNLSEHHDMYVPPLVTVVGVWVMNCGGTGNAISKVGMMLIVSLPIGRGLDRDNMALSLLGIWSLRVWGWMFGLGIWQAWTFVLPGRGIYRMGEVSRLGDILGDTSCYICTQSTTWKTPCHLKDLIW